MAVASVLPIPKMQRLPATLPLENAVRLELEEGVPSFARRLLFRPELNCCWINSGSQISLRVRAKNLICMKSSMII